MPVIPGFRILNVEMKGEGKLTEISCEKLAGGLAEASESRLYPGNHKVKIKSIVKTGDTYRLRIKGITRSSLIVGAVLTSSEWPITENREALLLHDGQPVPSETEAVRGGICQDFNRERFIGRGSFHVEGSFVSIKFPKPYPMFPGATLTILGQDRIPRTFTLLWPGKPGLEERRRLNGMARRRPDPHPDPAEIYGRILHVRGYVDIPPMLKKMDWEGAGRVGSWLILEDRKKVLERKILKIVSRPGGADDRLLSFEDYPFDLVSAAVKSMSRRGDLVYRNGWYFPSGQPPLSPFHRGWIGKVRDAGEEGIRIRSVSGESDRKALEELLRSGLIRGGAGIWLSEEACKTLEARLLDGHKKGDSISMADARESLGGSRVRTLEILVILESDGRLVPAAQGEDRIVS
jgi:hypothetical protein